jgi:hypothetical protein
MRTRTNNVTQSRGVRSVGENLGKILKEMYKCPNNHIFAQLVNGATLNEQTAWVHQYILAGKVKAGSKIKLTLTLVDAIWNAQERQQLIHHQLPNIPAHRVIEQIVNRCRLAIHLLRHKKLPNSPTPSGQAGCQIVGMANALIRYNKNEVALEKYVPRWKTEGQPIPAGHTLQSVVDKHIQTIKAKNNVLLGVIGGGSEA